MKKKSLALLLALTMLLALVACGDSGSASDTDAPASQPGEGVNTPPAEPAKDSIVIATARETAGFYPHCDEVEVTAQSYITIGQIYDTLFYINESGEVVPQLAETWKVSDDHLTYTITIRDATFHNGEKVTAEDVVFSFEQAAACGQQSLIRFLDHSEAVDEKTVVMYLNDTSPIFLNSLATRAGYIIDKSYYEACGGWEGYNDDPIGSGPYKVVSRASGDSVVLTAYEGYWGEAPAIKDVTIRVISDANSQIVALESGAVDVVVNPTNSSLSFMNTGNGVTWTSCPGGTRTTIKFNAAPGQVSANKDFRLAVASAINREDLIIGVTEGYSPDLNPTEQVWRITRREVTHNTYFANAQILEDTLDAHFATYRLPNKKLASLCTFKCEN